MGTINQHKMRRIAQELIRGLTRNSDLGFGFTIIVHAPRPSNGEWPMALETTLTSRQQYRALLAEAVTSSVLVDGGSSDIAKSDYELVLGGKARTS